MQLVHNMDSHPSMAVTCSLNRSHDSKSILNCATALCGGVKVVNCPFDLRRGAKARNHPNILGLSHSWFLSIQVLQITDSEPASEHDHPTHTESHVSR